MVNPQLLDYIRDVRLKGFSDEQIKNHLINHNYSKAEVDESFLLLSTDIQQNLQNIEKKETKKEVIVKKPKTKKKHAVLFIILFLCLLLLGILGYFFYQSTRYIGCENVSISIHKIKDEEVLCVFPDNSKIMTIIKNNGQENIKNLIFKIKGKGITTKKLENVNIQPDAISTHTIEYGKENISKIILIPETNEKVCQGIVFKEIKTC